MADKPKLARQVMCDRLAMEFQDGWIVNLGVGMPTLCSNYVDPEKEIITHSENGVIGYGPLAEEGKEDKHLVNASGQFVTSRPGMSIVHHADSFGVIRGGMVDVTVMGAYEVAENGDFANWRIPTRKGGGIGGAMDLAVGMIAVGGATTAYILYGASDGVGALIELPAPDQDDPGSARARFGLGIARSPL